MAPAHSPSPPSPLPPDPLPFTTSPGSDRARAKKQAEDALRGTETCVFVQSFDAGSQTGAAAATIGRAGGIVVRQACLGPSDRRQDGDGLLAALTLALRVVIGCPRVNRACFLVPHRATVSAMEPDSDSPRCESNPLVCLFCQQLASIVRRTCRSLQVRIMWAPLNPQDHDAAHLAVAAARAAADGLESTMDHISNSPYPLGSLGSLGLLRL